MQKIGTNAKISIDTKINTNAKIGTDPKININTKISTNMKINTNELIFYFPCKLREISVNIMST
jgi:UDP-3-O-[3-hydroxymyristoyl] glucosamine N-acyltransferase